MLLYQDQVYKLQRSWHKCTVFSIAQLFVLISFVKHKNKSKNYIPNDSEVEWDKME